jgi:putative endonuclease
MGCKWSAVRVGVPRLVDRGADYLLLFYFLDMYYTYILYSESLKKFYTGQTEDIERRILEHNYGKTAFMMTGIPWLKVYSKEFETRGEAMSLEKKIKKRGALRFLSDQGIEIG